MRLAGGSLSRSTAGTGPSAGSRGLAVGFSWCQRRGRTHDRASSRCFALELDEDRRKEEDGTGDFHGEGSRHRSSATTAAQVFVEDEAHDRQTEVIRKGEP
jgi:hypothetical protein